MKNHAQVQWSVLPDNVEVLYLDLEIHFGIPNKFGRYVAIVGICIGR